MAKTLRLILGDQLNQQHTWLKEVNPNVLYVMMEMRQETDYVIHHIQKVIGFFAAMRNFSAELSAKGHKFVYLKINDNKNKQSLTENLKQIIEEFKVGRFEYLLPDEYRLDKQLKDFCKTIDIPSEATDSEHFITERMELKKMFDGKKTYLMESFYRKIRAKHQILMQHGEPVGGQWNFDHDNRNKYDEKVPIPAIEMNLSNQEEIFEDINRAGVKTMGSVDAKAYIWPVNRTDALKLLKGFTEKALPYFGKYQDAMYAKNSWLFHSRLSFAMNIKLLHPLEVVNAGIAAWQKNKELIDLAQLEGFVRQIIGWREYMRGVYWAQMPEYADKNYFNHQRKLPQWYWTADTKMACLKHAITQSLTLAYAHHIQRLMITGNFALLAGIHPDDVDQWYLGIYIDAIEWVEITNTRGMSQFADGGLLATKPYVSSANYINNMSDYCKSCAYDHKKRHGEKACPFNSLYWNFHLEQRDLLGKNPRIGMVYRNIDKMSAEERQMIQEQASKYLADMDNL